jgi:hypothetical protein
MTTTVFVAVARNGGTLDDVAVCREETDGLGTIIGWRGDMRPSDLDAEVECLGCDEQIVLDAEDSSVDGDPNVWVSKTSGWLCSGENKPHEPDPRQAEWDDGAGGYWNFDVFEREVG